MASVVEVDGKAVEGYRGTRAVGIIDHNIVATRGGGGGVDGIHGFGERCDTIEVETVGTRGNGVRNTVEVDRFARIPGGTIDVGRVDKHFAATHRLGKDADVAALPFATYSQRGQQ